MAGEHNAQSSLLTIRSKQGAFRQRTVQTDVQCSTHHTTYVFPYLPSMTRTASPPQHHCGLSVESVAGLVCLVSPVSCSVIFPACLVVGIAQILILFPRAHRYRLPLPSATPTPVPNSLLPQSWSLPGFGCSPAVPSPQSQSIFESCRLHIPHSLVVPSSHPPPAVPNASKFKHFRDRSGQKTPDSFK